MKTKSRDAHMMKEIIRELENHKNTLAALLDRLLIKIESDCRADVLFTSTYAAILKGQAKANIQIARNMEMAIDDANNEKRAKEVNRDG